MGKIYYVDEFVKYDRFYCQENTVKIHCKNSYEKEIINIMYNGGESRNDKMCYLFKYGNFWTYCHYNVDGITHILAEEIIKTEIELYARIIYRTNEA